MIRRHSIIEHMCDRCRATVCTGDYKIPPVGFAYSTTAGWLLLKAYTLNTGVAAVDKHLCPACSSKLSAFMEVDKP